MNTSQYRSRRHGYTAGLPCILQVYCRAKAQEGCNQACDGCTGWQQCTLACQHASGGERALTTSAATLTATWPQELLAYLHMQPLQHAIPCLVNHFKLC